MNVDVRPVIAILIISILGCSGRWIEPIASYLPASTLSTYNNIGEYMSAHGCARAVSLVGGNLSRTYTPWDPSIALGSGPDFLPTFEKRYGIKYTERRSPVEVETIVETYERVRSAIESHPEVLNLPAGYRLTEQDKTDLFYVTCDRGGLALREVLEPLLVSPEPVPVEPVEPVPGPPELLPGPVLPPGTSPVPSDPPLPPVCPPVVPCEVCPPTTPLPFALSPESLSTLNSLSKWVTGNGHKSKVNKLVREIKDKIKVQVVRSVRSTGQVNVVVVP